MSLPVVEIQMSAWGRQRPLTILSAQRPLSGVKWKLKKLEILDFDFRFRPIPGDSDHRYRFS